MKSPTVMFLAAAIGLMAGCAELQSPYPGTNAQPVPTTQAAGRISFHELVERLEVLESLRERGLLTEREHQDAKRPLVDMLASGDVIVSDNAAASTYSSPVPVRHGYGQDH